MLTSSHSCTKEFESMIFVSSAIPTMTSEILLTIPKSFFESLDAVEEGCWSCSTQIEEGRKAVHTVPLKFFATHHIGKFSGHHLSRRESHKDHRDVTDKHQRK